MVTIIKPHLRIQNTEYVGNHTFKCGQVVPIYDVLNYHGFNQILGHVKFNNRDYGNVYYRGENKLHDTLKPSLMRKGDNPHKLSGVLTTIINSVLNDKHLKETLKLETNNAKHIDVFRSILFGTNRDRRDFLPCYYQWQEMPKMTDLEVAKLLSTAA